MQDGSTETPAAQSPTEALLSTDRNLRRLLRYINDTNPSPDDDLDKMIRRAKRQLRANKELLGDEGSGLA